MASGIQGVKSMAAMLKRFARKTPEAIGAALYQEAQIEMTEAKRRTPVSPTPAPPGVVPGTLRASGQVSEPIRKGQNISVVLSFGGAAEAYAVVQHENLEFFHTTGQAKYLESVLNESRSHMAARLVRRFDLNKMKV